LKKKNKIKKEFGKGKREEMLAKIKRKLKEFRR